MYRAFYCTVAVCSISSFACGQQALVQHISFTSKAASVSNTLAALSAASKTPMMAGTDVAKDTLMLRLVDVPLGEAMKKIAEAEIATWELKSGKWILHRTQGKEQEREEQDVRYRSARIRSAFDILAKQAAAAPATDDFESFRAEMDAVYTAVAAHKKIDSGTIRDRMPANRLFSQIVPMLEIESIARAGNDRVIYSTNPTAAQLALPESVSPLLTQFVKKQQLLISAIAKREHKMPDFGLEDVNEPRLLGGDPLVGIGKLLVIVRKQLRFESYRVDMKIFDKRGDLMFWEFRTFNPEALKAPLSFPEKEEPIPLSPLSAELAKLASDKGASGALSMMLPLGSAEGQIEYLQLTSNRRTPLSIASPALLAATADPQKVDPLSFAVSDNLSAIAERRNDNLVAALPDALFLIFNGLVAVKPATQQKVFTSQGVLENVHFSEGGGWLCIRPNEPAMSAAMQVERTTLSNAVAAVRREGVLPLSNLLRIAEADLKPLQKELPDMDSLYLRLTKPALDMPGFDYDWKALRVIASLSTQQWDALRQGTAVTGDAQLFADWLFNSGNGPVIRVSGKSYTDSGMFNSGRSLATERTEAFPQGVPSGAALSAQMHVTPAAFGLDPVSGREELVTPRSLATYRIQSEMPRFATGLGQPPAFQKFTEAVDTNWKFFITLHREVSVTELNLHDIQRRKDAKPGALPQAIAEGAKQEYRRLASLVKSSGW